MSCCPPARRRRHLPQQPAPALVYPGAVALPARDLASALEALFARNGWGGAPRARALHLPPRSQHRARGARRVSGKVRVQLGGERGVPIVLSAGDVAVIPAGVAARTSRRAGDFRVVAPIPRGRRRICSAGAPARATRHRSRHRGAGAPRGRSRRGAMGDAGEAVASPRPRRSRPAARWNSSTTRWCCCGASRDDGAARDLPAATRRGFGFAAGARARAVPARSRGLAPVPAAVVPGARGVHARLRRGRPALDLERARRRGGVHGAGRPPRARPASGSCSTSSRTTWRPTTRTASGRIARCGRSSSTSTRRPAATGASSTSTISPRVRQEDPEVFEATQRSRCGSCARASWTGCGSTTRTGWPTRRATSNGCARGRPARVGGEDPRPGRALRDWPVEGTVGYEFLNDVGALFVDPAGEAPLTDLWVEVSSDDRRFGELGLRGQARAGAHDVRAGGRAAAARRRPSASTGSSARWPRCPVYRTYVEPWSGHVDDADREAVAEAGLPASLARVLQLEDPGWEAFVTRFQQTTPPVMAKGVEDTAFYRYARLLALNDVGGDPVALGTSRVDAFHAANPSAPSASRATCSSPRRTTPSARATCARGSARWPRWPRSRGDVALARATAGR